MRAALPFYMAQLETRHEQPASSLHWMMECRSILAFADMLLVTMPVKRKFDKRAAFEQAVRECKGWRKLGRDHAELLYYRARGRLQHSLEERDTRAFLAYAVQSLEMVLMYDSADLSRSAVARPNPAKVETRKVRHP
jgi:hypothetical protein